MPIPLVYLPENFEAGVKPQNFLSFNLGKLSDHQGAAGYNINAIF